MRSTSYEMLQRDDYPGISFYDGDKDYVTCDETIFQYFDKNAGEYGDCVLLYNFTRTHDFEFTIMSSRNGRCTIEFWFYVEEASNLSPGVNLLLENHMSVSIIRDINNKDTINALCFPQEYRESVDGIGGMEVYDLFNQATNADKYAFNEGGSRWQFVRCVADGTRKFYYVGDNEETELLPEFLYGGTRNYRPFRFFGQSKYQKFKVQNAKKNPTRIFLRQVRAYAEYIPKELIKIKFYNCTNFTKIWPMRLCFDVSEANWPKTGTLNLYSFPSFCVFQ